MNRLVRAVRRDDGSTLPLIMVYALIALVLVVLVAAVTSLYIERKRLFSVADSLAIVGADAYTVTGDGTARPTVTDASVRAAAESYLTGDDPSRFDAFRLDEASAPDGATAQVTVSAQWHPPLVGPVVPASVRLSATSRARGVLW